MSLFCLRRLMRMMLILWLGMDSLAMAQQGCPPGQEIAKIYDQRWKVLSLLKSNLQKLSQGEIIETGLSVLFVVDLNRPEAVKARIAEIQDYLSMDIAQHMANDRYFKCVEKDAALLKRLEDIEVLEIEANRLRLTLLSLNDEQRHALQTIQQQASKTKEALEEIERQKNVAAEKAETAEQAMLDAESQVQLAASDDLRKLATEKALLENHRRAMAQLSLQWNKQLEQILEQSRMHTEMLSQDASVLARFDVPEDELLNAYRDVVSRWSQLTDQVLSSFTTIEPIPVVPELVGFDEALRKELQNDPALKDYTEAWQAAKGERERLQQLRNRLVGEQTESSYRLLLLAGRIRTDFIQELVERNHVEIFSFSNEYFADLFREIRLIPYRPLVFIKYEIIEAGRLVTGGISGVLTLVKRLILLFLFFLTPVITYKMLRLGSKRLDYLREWLITSRRTWDKGPMLALWIKRLNPYLFWLILFIAARFAAGVVAGTELAAVAEILPYFEYFFVYQIFRIAVENSLLSMAVYLPDASTYQELTQRVSRTARQFGLYFLTAAYLLKGTQSIARAGLIYHLVWSVLFWITPFMLFYGAYSWRYEIAILLSQVLPEKYVSRYKQWCSAKRVAAVISFPALLLGLFMLSLRFVLRVAGRFDSIKAISAQIFRRKIESAAKARARQGDLPNDKVGDEYRIFFHLDGAEDSSLMIEPEDFPLEEVLHGIQHWLKGNEERHTVAIHGVKGVGKTSFFQRLKLELDEVDVKHAVVRKKITDAAEMLEYISEILGIDTLKTETDLLLFDSRCAKTVVMIDDGQNFFLAQRGGFEAFKMLTRLMNVGTRNIFWCVAFNRYSWTYLNAVTGGSEYFRSVHPIERWGDRDICNMIMTRHAQSGYELRFDTLIFATESNQGLERSGYIKDRFFELLWEQAKGNPRTAIVLWLESLKPIGQSSLLVGLPPTPPSKPLAGLTDDEIFVIAAIIRHENLTIDEACTVTSLADSIVRHALRIGIERNFLDRSTSGRYRITPMWQTPLTQQLISKNFVYE